MDVLDDILDALSVQGALYFYADLAAPWGVTIPDLHQAARFHLVICGSCHVGFASGSTLTLGAGDLVVIPRGRSHVLADTPRRRAPPLETMLEETGYDGSGTLIAGSRDRFATTKMLCGHFTFRSGADHPLLRSLPEYLTALASDRDPDSWLSELLRLITSRVFQQDLHSAATITRLSEIVFIELLRSAVQKDAAFESVLAAFRDQHIGRALHLMHRKSEEPWTVDSLARHVGMSRSRFAERFRHLLGIGPMAYLSDWRLRKALTLLHDPRASVQQVARQIGYDSPAAFTRAFSSKFGMAPTEYRRETA
jgi:AraC-like DNA-binding protein